MAGIEHEIKTMQDVIDCVTSENIDRFMVDFRGYVQSAISMKELRDLFCEVEGIPKDKMDTNGWIWIDDGKNNIDIEITD